MRPSPFDLVLISTLTAEVELRVPCYDYRHPCASSSLSSQSTKPFLALSKDLSAAFFLFCVHVPISLRLRHYIVFVFVSLSVKGSMVISTLVADARAAASIFVGNL